MIKETCKLHGETDHIYSKTMAAYACSECVRSGFFREDITKAILEVELKTRIKNDLLGARKAQDKKRTMELSYILSLLEENEKSTAANDPMAVLKAYKKKLTKSLDTYKDVPQHRATAEYGLAILEEYIPQGMAESEVKIIVANIIAEMRQDEDNINVGTVMRAAMPTLKELTDSAVVAKVTKELLSE